MHVSQHEWAYSFYPHYRDGNTVSVFVTLLMEKSPVFDNQEIFGRIYIWVPTTDLEGFLSSSDSTATGTHD